MKDYTIEQEDGKWYVWKDNICINERTPFETEEQAINWIPEYEADQAEHYYQRMIDLADTFKIKQL